MQIGLGVARSGRSEELEHVGVLEDAQWLRDAFVSPRGDTFAGVSIVRSKRAALN